MTAYARSKNASRWRNKMRSMVSLAFCFLTGLQGYAQTKVDLLRERIASERPALMVLGVPHFANPGRDLVNRRVEDVLAEPRQREIESLVSQLAAFKPTVIAVEWPADKQAALDDRYRAYREGKYVLGRHEIDQVGLRLAARLGLGHVVAADWNLAGPGDADSYDWPAYASSSGQQTVLDAIVDPTRTLGDTPLGNLTIGGWLRRMNEPETLAASHRNYFDIAVIGDAKAQPGAAWVGHWYARNLRIFATLSGLVNNRDDRVLAIYGAGHAYLLNQFSSESGAFEVVPVSQWLKE